MYWIEFYINFMRMFRNVIAARLLANVISISFFFFAPFFWFCFVDFPPNENNLLLMIFSYFSKWALYLTICDWLTVMFASHHDGRAVRFQPDLTDAEWTGQHVNGDQRRTHQRFFRKKENKTKEQRNETTDAERPFVHCFTRRRITEDSLKY